MSDYTINQSELSTLQYGSIAVIELDQIRGGVWIPNPKESDRLVV